jgi:hypothetical protein
MLVDLVNLVRTFALSISHPGSLAMFGIQFSPGTSGGSSEERALTLTEGTFLSLGWGVTFGAVIGGQVSRDYHHSLLFLRCSHIVVYCTK